MTGWWNPSPTKLGKVIKDLKHVLAPLKLLGVSSMQIAGLGTRGTAICILLGYDTVSSLRALKIWGKPNSLNLKPPQCHNHPNFNNYHILKQITNAANLFLKTVQGICSCRAFGKISVKFSVLGILYSHPSPMGVKFGMEKWNSMPNFTPISATCYHCSLKNLKIAVFTSYDLQPEHRADYSRRWRQVRK